LSEYKTIQKFYSEKLIVCLDKKFSNPRVNLVFRQIVDVCGHALAFLANITLGWKGLPGVNTLAYHEHL